MPVNPLQLHAQNFAFAFGREKFLPLRLTQIEFRRLGRWQMFSGQPLRPLTFGNFSIGAQFRAARGPFFVFQALPAFAFRLPGDRLQLRLVAIKIAARRFQFLPKIFEFAFRFRHGKFQTLRQFRLPPLQFRQPRVQFGQTIFILMALMIVPIKAQQGKRQRAADDIQRLHAEAAGEVEIKRRERAQYEQKAQPEKRGIPFDRQCFQPLDLIG